ncbi:hypothetical protein PENFLA_c013G00058 [Penicillium flavigenum]|uniref:Uncharacterized protein n=1 Tax=Penicillium flavigenum TaxID=254877 RepID=A0A1V6T7Z2_9EURO|nr:hypothetical protein PENFLA_c013G00058 [Penicillium flavigenum]
MDSFFFEFALEPHIWRSNKYHLGTPGRGLLYSLYCRLSGGVSIGIPNCRGAISLGSCFVFTQFINETGWPDGLAWLLGLLQGGLCLIGVDAVAHMIEGKASCLFYCKTSLA